MKALVKTYITVLGFLAVVSVAAGESVAVAEANDSSEKDQVMYSYSEAVVGDNGKPVISQLTIAKGKDGQFHYARNENGIVKSGKWNGPLPSTPDLKSLGVGLTEVSNLADPLTVLTQSIGNTVQQYILQALRF